MKPKTKKKTALEFKETRARRAIISGLVREMRGRAALIFLVAAAEDMQNREDKHNEAARSGALDIAVDYAKNHLSEPRLDADSPVFAE